MHLIYKFLEEFLESIITISVITYMIKGELDVYRILIMSSVVAILIVTLVYYKSEYGKTFKSAMITSLATASIKAVHA